MSDRWFHVIPRTRPMSAFYLVVGLVLILTTGYRVLTEGAAVLPVVALVAALALVVTAVIGLVSPPTGR
ncbi:hypothetical protein [Actinoplanes sp. NPDC089786]|uniref:hypothetical protein n=1 Tax=Actinoplanes sp. NPDC089786 TaxID=3155185 RepID=UPI003442665F